MNDQAAKLLEQHFDTAFAAPDGIARLRELILTLAMQGKLVKQDPKDPPASELLEEIEAEKRRLVKAGKIKQPKPLPVIKPEEMPYELPQGWEWVRLGDIGNWKSGSTPSRSNTSFYGGDIPWVKSGEVKQGRIKSTEETITQAALTRCPLQINEKGSVLVAMYGANIGEVGILEIEAATNQAVCACTTYTSFDENYLLYLITSLKPYFLSQGAGAAQPNISREKIVATMFPLPPLPEQHRIVARIDQLMTRCDTLEKLRKEREEKRVAVHAAAIRQLLDPTFASSRLRAHNFLFSHFGELYAVKENVAELRKAILQLAVMGRLVPQDPKDPPASELLKEIEAEKRRLVKAGKIKQPKPLPPIKPEEAPYELPRGWEWVRLGDIVSLLGDGIHGTPDYDGTGEYYFINGNNLSDGAIELKENTKRVSVIAYEKHKKELTNRTVLVSINGTIGKVAFYNGEPVILGKSVCYFNLYTQIEKRYIKKIINCSYFLEYAYQSATGTTIKNVSLKAMREFYVPLPPLPEQHRIVARIDQLMALCDSLDQGIDAAARKQRELLDAVMDAV